MEHTQQDYDTGYRHGSDASLPDTREVKDRAAYLEGFAKGTENQPHIVIPEWMTPAQVEAVGKLYARSADGSLNRHAFFQRVSDYGDYCGLGWCGMFMGIEKDGYTHS
jgi:hypothetical protein